MAMRVLNRIPLFLLTAVGVSLLLILTLIPAHQAPELPTIPMADKVAHALMFGCVTLAALWDIGRYSGRLSTSTYLVTALEMTALGGVIEVLQAMMGYGRSGDWADLVADAAGAFLIPLLALPLLNKWIERYQLDVEIGARPGKRILERLKQLYFNSFPPEERREWSQLTDLLQMKDSPVRLVVIRVRGRWAGFLTLWNLGEAVYVEHFAIEPELRGCGIGSRALREVIAATDRPIVLEVEPAHRGDEARRRIAFYESNGLIGFSDVPYIQPSYGPGLPDVELMLMATSPDVNPVSLTGSLHAKVYGRPI